MPTLHTTAGLLAKVSARRTRNAPTRCESRGDRLSHAGRSRGAGEDVSKRATSRLRTAGPHGAKVQGARDPALPRPFEPGRAEPPLPIADDFEAFVVPPLRGKAHPPAEMDEATPTLDDEKRSYRHHPNDAGTTAFGFDPDAADAAADLAGELGATFLSGATYGEDMSDVTMTREEAQEASDLRVVDEEEEVGAAPPRRAGRSGRR